MYIVKKNDEDKVNKVSEIVGKMAMRLSDIINQILACKPEGRLTVEVIEQAISILEEEKE